MCSASIPVYPTFEVNGTAKGTEKLKELTKLVEQLPEEDQPKRKLQLKLIRLRLDLCQALDQLHSTMTAIKTTGDHLEEIEKAAGLHSEDAKETEES